MCGYHELLTPCCNEKTGFTPSSSHKCSHYLVNNRHCRTGSIHSWIVSSPAMFSNTTCSNCRKLKEHETKQINDQIREEERIVEEERKAAERAEEERRQMEDARELRGWGKELRRSRKERSEGKMSAAEALRSQLAGLKIDDGKGPSTSLSEASSLLSKSLTRLLPSNSSLQRFLLTVKSDHLQTSVIMCSKRVTRYVFCPYRYNLVTEEKLCLKKGVIAPCLEWKWLIINELRTEGPCPCADCEILKRNQAIQASGSEGKAYFKDSSQ
ncbi:hypothetical protein E4T39_06171 [Aureobasidium subglaciale]|nr:hypothetical protein E4T39_06171 [Aureobasidium subglaciale]